MTALVDIGNRALQLLGTRTTMASLTEQSNEALLINLSISEVVNWCFGLSNWNFARLAGVLTLNKSAPAGGGVWSNAYPAPPWQYEYALPGDFIRAIYLTNNAAGVNGGWAGEPQRFAIGYSTTSGFPILLTNQPAATLIYTANSMSPNAWPWYFERLAVMAVAATNCIALTGDRKLLEELSMSVEQQINIAAQINMAEGLYIDDTSVEWIQALGINYPYRRIEGRPGIQPQPRARGRAQQGEDK